MGIAYYKGDCPHCRAKGAGFTSLGQHVLGDERASADWSVFMTCNLCSRGIVLEVRLSTGQRTSGPLSEPHNLTLSTVVKGQAGVHYDIVGIYPKPTISRAPNDVPTKIAVTYIESCDNKQAQHYETSAILARKVIDLATKVLRGEAAKSEKLYQRIDALREEGVITEAMADWAHAVRLDGNGPTHSDEDVNEVEATNLLNFTEAFLLYSFTLPAMVSRRETPTSLA